MNPIRKYRIERIRDLTQTTKAFILSPVDEPIKYEAGQFAFIHLLDENGESRLKRPYSIASAPEDEEIEFCIKMIQGQMTGVLEKMREGELLGIQKGGGHFSYKGEERAAFISGGTGIAPIISMLRHIANTKKKGDFIAFYSARSKDEILYWSELRELQEANKGIKIVITLTR
jgi:ferredoxin-NADP reductase